MKLYKTDKVVFSVQNNAGQFLNGLTSNTLDADNNAFLNIHGKIIVTFDQIRINDDHFLILIEKSFENDMLQHLDRYLKLGKAKLTKEDYHVYFDLTGEYTASNEEYTIAQKKGKLIVTKNQLDTNVSDEEFTQFRVKNNIVLHGVDYKDEMLLNVSTTDFVSFTKGCFLGQEPLSKVYNRSKPSWKLESKFEDELDGSQRGEMTSKIIDPETNRPMGFVFVSNKD